MRHKSLIIATVIILLFSNLVFAENTVDYVKVGLDYGDSSIKNAYVTFNSLVELFTLGDDGYEMITVFDKNSIYANLTNVYSVVVDGDGNYNEVFDVLKDQENYVFYHYGENGLKAATGIFYSFGDAEAFKNELSDKYTAYTYKILEPSNNMIMLTSDEDYLLYFDSNEYELGFRSLNDEVKTFKYKDRNYRQGVMFNSHGVDGINIINYLSTSEYLYGVVPREMSKTWPLEALKAQAVAARNYYMNSRGKHSDLGFDICDTVDCQVYGGFDYEGEISNRAVDETEGKYLYYNDELVTTYFYSDSGGYSANSEDVWSSEVPYLRAVEDGFETDSPNDYWSKSYSKDEIASVLTSRGYNVGRVLDVKITETAEGGRVKNLSIIGSDDTLNLEKQKARVVFGYNTIKSMLFNIRKDDNITLLSKNGLSSLKSDTVQVMSASGLSNIDGNLTSFDGSTLSVLTKADNDFVFVGSGWGHGVGMSQWGAKKMAELGYSYEEILTHYYMGTKVR